MARPFGILQQLDDGAALDDKFDPGPGAAASISVRPVLKEVVITAPWRALTNISSRSEGFRYLRTGFLSGKPLDDGRSVVEMP